MTKQISELDSIPQRLLTKIILMTFSAFCLSSWLTAKGLFDKAIEAGVSNTEGMITAAMTAVVAATLIGGGTMLLFGIAINTVKRQRWQVAKLAVTLMPFVLGVSTYYAILGNAGSSSLIYNMRDSAISHAQYYEQATTDSSSAQSAQSTLLPLQASICGLAGDEKISGILTGSSGRGAVYAAYASNCKSIQTIIGTLAETVKRTIARREKATDILSKLNTIPKNTILSVFERQAVFRDQVSSLHELIAKSSAEKVAQRLSAQLEILESSVATLNIQDGKFGQKQTHAIQNLKNALKLVSTTVNKLVDNGKSTFIEPPKELLEMGIAVAVYWKRNIPQILLAILIDTMNLWFICLLMVSRSTSQIRRQEMLEANDSQTSIFTSTHQLKEGVSK